MNRFNRMIFLRDLLHTFLKMKNVPDILYNHQDGALKTVNRNNLEKLLSMPKTPRTPLKKGK